MPYKNRETRLAWYRHWRETNPERANEMQYRWQAKNKDKVKTYSQRYREKNGEKRRIWERRWAGLPEPTRPPPDHCEKCKKPRSQLKNALSLDHDHKTGAFRGWLCTRCNIGIGALGDTLEGLYEAVQYLQDAELLS